MEPPTRHAHKSNSFDASSAQRPKLTGAAAELFVCIGPLIFPPLPAIDKALESLTLLAQENLTITDHDRELKRQLNQNTQYQNTQFNQNPDRVPPRLNTQGNQIPSFKGRPSPPPPPGHRHSKSSDSRPPNSTSNSMNPFPTDRERTKPPVPAIRQPPREPPRPRQRRNSDSSIMEVPHDMDNERAKEKERRERRAAREGRDARDGSRGPGRETGRNRGESASSARDKDGGRRPSKPITGKPRKGSPLDVIDKLDVTGIYGSGCRFYLPLFFALIVCLLTDIIMMQYSTMMVPSMHATLIEIKIRTGLQCKHSPRAQQITLLLGSGRCQTKGTTQRYLGLATPRHISITI